MWLKIREERVIRVSHPQGEDKRVTTTVSHELEEFEATFTLRCSGCLHAFDSYNYKAHFVE